MILATAGQWGSVYTPTPHLMTGLAQHASSTCLEDTSYTSLMRLAGGP